MDENVSEELATYTAHGHDDRQGDEGREHGAHGCLPVRFHLHTTHHTPHTTHHTPHTTHHTPHTTHPKHSKLQNRLKWERRMGCASKSPHGDWQVVGTYHQRPVGDEPLWERQVPHTVPSLGIVTVIPVGQPVTGAHGTNKADFRGGVVKQVASAGPHTGADAVRVIFIDAVCVDRRRLTEAPVHNRPASSKGVPKPARARIGGGVI